MKKIVYLLAFMLTGLFSFSSNIVVKKETTKPKKEEPKIVVYEDTKKEALDCKDKGGTCLVTIYTNGVPRSFERCCNDIVIVKRNITEQ